MLNAIAWISQGIAFTCAIIASDEIHHPQKMWIMNIAWPVASVYPALPINGLLVKIGWKEAMG